ncbi:hypothetical protein NDU88_008296 [Pleurodeles waltl]|uniref:Uncharacterized protein n=1 Tax=Pleurodeles waltl TaxID=8319 RepID=A0AAV7SUY3_PLEWA|nr:hypothetical protein NDU88_008296 [Pleurodeles waltl]
MTTLHRTLVPSPRAEQSHQTPRSSHRVALFTSGTAVHRCRPGLEEPVTTSQLSGTAVGHTRAPRVPSGLEGPSRPLPPHNTAGRSVLQNSPFAAILTLLEGPQARCTRRWPGSPALSRWPLQVLRGRSQQQPPGHWVRGPRPRTVYVRLPLRPSARRLSGPTHTAPPRGPGVAQPSAPLTVFRAEVPAWPPATRGLCGALPPDQAWPRGPPHRNSGRPVRPLGAASNLSHPGPLRRRVPGPAVLLWPGDSSCKEAGDSPGSDGCSDYIHKHRALPSGVESYRWLMKEVPRSLLVMMMVIIKCSASRELLKAPEGDAVASDDDDGDDGYDDSEDGDDIDDDGDDDDY